MAVQVPEAANYEGLSRAKMTRDLLPGAIHAVLRTLYSRAHRIGSDGNSCLLSGLCKSLSLDLFRVVIVRVLA